MDNKINLIIDFDSTFIKLETIEVLADFALENKKDKKKILDLIKICLQGRFLLLPR